MSESAFSDYSAQDTHLAALEAQQWIEVSNTYYSIVASVPKEIITFCLVFWHDIVYNTSIAVSVMLWCCSANHPFAPLLVTCLLFMI